MSGYFDALLRSAGSPLAAARPLAPGRPLARDAADRPEQETAIEATAQPPDLTMPRRPAAFEMAAVEAVEAVEEVSRTARPSGAGEPDHSPHARGQAPSAQAAPRQPASGLPSSPLTALAAEGDVHPVVRAALRWVAADPSLVEREAGHTGGPVESASALALPVQPARTVPAYAARAQADERATEQGIATENLPPAAARTQPSPADQEMILTWAAPPPPPRPHVDVRRRPPARQPDQIEVHIGTIHVAVDAPATPRATIQPATPPARPQTRPAARSGFGRSRLPRL